jgi:hypothetical protein
MAQLVNDASLIYAGDYEQLTGLSSAKRLQSIPAGARVALIQATDQNVRWKDDGNDPTTSTGMQLAAGKDLFYTGNLANLSFIEETATAKLNVLYYQ